MKRILVFISMLLCLTAVMATGGGDDDCGKGNNNPNPDPEHPHDPLDDTSTSGGISADPNEIIGPSGYDDSIRWVSINDLLNYTILFENDPEFATANAQKVDVRFSFDDKAAMKGFGLGTYGFANMSWNIDDAPAAYQNRLDLRDTMHIYVDLTAGIDVVKQQAFWLFNSIDPETGYNPWQVDRGMLPVNDSTHVGEGFVTFHLKPQEDLKTGDTISIVASIVFDQNDTIPTNRWRNTIDAGMPTSKVNGRQDSKNENLYHLTLLASDDEGGSGMRRVLLYQANNFGIYEEVASCPVDTVIDFMAEPGHQYRFYSIAEDNVGNREPLKEQPDLIINVNAAPNDIAISNSSFQDDLAADGFIAELTSKDVEEGGTFIYALAEGDSAIHNDLFKINGTQLQAKNSFKCADDTIYYIRLSTTDEGGLSFSKAFALTMKQVLVRPEPDTLDIAICDGEFYDFHGKKCVEAGTYRYYQGNENMCDSIFVLNLTVLPIPEQPTVSVEGIITLVSSAVKGNQWFRIDGTPVEGATDQQFTPAEDGIYYVAVSNGSCYSEPSKLYQVLLSDELDLQLDLSEGWNWISSSLSETEYVDAKQFLEPIKDVTERLAGQTKELINDPINGLTGELTTINPVEGYKLKVSDNVSNIWSGHVSDPATASVSLQEGWNWIGYLPVAGNDLASALSGLTPSENDVIKFMDDFSIYSNGSWVGTLDRLNPGEGYMYFATNASKFNYPIQRVFPVNEKTQNSAIRYDSNWDYDIHRYPDNTTLIGQVFVNESQIIEGSFTVGAFVDNECRGIGKFVDGKLFMTVHGTINDDQVIAFRAYENVTGQEYSIGETIQFNGQHEGSVNAPVALHINVTTGIVSIQNDSFIIYPKPLRTRMYINGKVKDIKNIQILSGNGVTLINHQGYNESGIDITILPAGMYVVAIINTNGEVYYEKVIKAQ